MKIDELSYEEAQKKLKDLLDKMENEELTLENSIKKFKIANQLYQHCNDLLNKAEGEVRIILDNDEKKEEDFSLEV